LMKTSSAEISETAEKRERSNWAKKGHIIASCCIRSFMISAWI